MKHLWLVRHAKSSWKDPSLGDFDRPLNRRGLSDAPEMGRRLAAGSTRPQVLVSSPAVRAKTTAEFIAAALGYPAEEIRWEDRIYHASTFELIRLIRQMADDIESAMFFGHNPTMTDAANVLSGSSIENVPTCGVVQLHLDIPSWAQVEDGVAHLLDFDYPKRKTRE
jgi:phosphohistidine phosphatase